MNRRWQIRTVRSHPEPAHLLSRLAATFSSIPNGGEGQGEEAFRFQGLTSLASVSLSQRERVRVRENAPCLLAILALSLALFCSCSKQPAAVTPEKIGYHGAVNWVSIEDLPLPLAQFETVFWDPRDTPSLRKLMRETDAVRAKRVLEIGTGTGLLALCALQAGAASAVATDINSNAVLNAKFNAALLGFSGKLELRLVAFTKPGAFEVIRDGEQFDVILSNPPWVNRAPQNIAEFALYDASFNLLRTLLDGLPKHLRPGGRCLLAYGCVDAIKTLQAECAKRGYSIRVVDDDRNLDKLPEEFLPGMLLEVTLPAGR
jgi:release factor glutamine methyltransferase